MGKDYRWGSGDTEFRGETLVEVSNDGWKETGVFLVALFVGGSVLLMGMGVWDLLSSAEAQQAFAKAIESIGYGATALLVLLGMGLFAYGASFLVRSTVPKHLSHGVKENGGVFRGDGLVITLPRDFDKLPETAQVEILKSLARYEGIPKLPSESGEKSPVEMWGRMR